jgi:hypothetical protein
MSLFTDNVNALVQMGPRRRLRGDTGRLDENGSVNPNPAIGLQTGEIWVRLRGERSAIAVLNLNVTTQRANIPVILEELDSGQLQVLQVEPEPAIFTYGSFAPALNMPDKPAEQEKSPVLHKRIKDLRLRLSSTGGLVLYVEAGIYRKSDGTLENFDGGTIDLTTSLPGVIDTKRIVMVGLDSSNALVQVAATAVDQATTLSVEPYFTREEFVTAANAASTANTYLWALPLLYGQTEFGNTDTFTDLRPIVRGVGTLPIAQGGTGQTTQTAAFDALSPTTTKGDVIASNGSDNVRLPVGATNGMVLSVDSSTATGLAWTLVGSTFEVSISTTDATVTNLITFVVAELQSVTIRGRFVAAKTDKTAAAGGFFRASFRRATGGNVTMVGSSYLEMEEDSAGAPILSFDVDTGAQTGRIRWQGVAAENWNVKAHYEYVTV